MIYPVVFTPSAEQDLVEAKQFYAKVDGRLGQYCADSLILDTERLAFFPVFILLYGVTIE
ncbi:MAG: hypothetical protein RBS36_08435 [Thiomicrospira sp.]|jgi:hypothetical protein|nr:hypothetical protein [Thiomicrospira sp.]